MKRFAGRSLWSVFLGTTLAMAMVSSALAAPLAPVRDRSDNGIYFTYDSETHSLPEYGSATGPITAGERDRVDFQVGVGLAKEGAESPLTAIVSLKLRGAKAVRYTGSFSVSIRILESDERVLKVTIPVDLVLRPTSGKRRKTLTAPLDLPSGSYSARGFFERA